MKPLINLKILHINDVSPNKECPNLAKELFANLPKGLENLRARDWKTHFAMNASCIIDQQTLEGLKILPNLTTPDFQYSDKIFGNTIPKSLFRGMEALQSLDLGWSRFNDIETGAFSGLTLTSLVLDSNQLGTREFWFYELDSPTLTSPVKTLSMFKCGIDAIDYYAYFITRSFPNLESLDLGYNDLVYLPQFREEGYITPASKIKWLSVANNILYDLAGQHMIDVCDLMPGLQNLNAESNRISYIISQTCVYRSQI